MAAPLFAVVAEMPLVSRPACAWRKIQPELLLVSARASLPACALRTIHPERLLVLARASLPACS